jgi:hypothetical protein
VSEDPQQRVATMQRERLTEVHDLGELIVGQPEREPFFR